MVDVVTTADFQALTATVQALDARVKVLEALPQAKTMPDTVKAALKTVLEWMDANV